MPSALRGLHAWIATLNSNVSEAFIIRDPYGFFRYGDPSVLNVMQSRILLKSLEKNADVDPYFRSEDWHLTLGRGLARKELREDIIRLISNPDSPYQLSHLILESLQGDEFANEISQDLLGLVFKKEVTPLERGAAVDALSECDPNPDWEVVVEKLRTLGDVESFRIALNIVERNAGLFTGKYIAKLLIELADEFSSGEGPLYSGIGYNLHQELSKKQLEEALDILVKAIDEEEVKHRGSRYGNKEDWVFKFLKEFCARGPLPPARKIWSWLKNLERHGYNRTDWDDFSSELLSQNVKYRREIQSEAMKSSNSPDELWMDIFHLGDASSGLWIKEDDLIFHLEDLINNKDSYLDWEERWVCLVRWALINRSFCGNALDLARNQAKINKVLSTHLTELEKAPARNYEQEQKERDNKYRKEKNSRDAERHLSYEKIQDKMLAGEHLEALGNVAKAFLGRFNDIQSITSKQRVIELVGSNAAKAAIEGLSVAMTRDDIPTAREIIELNANKHKSYFFEYILLAHCLILLESKRGLNGLTFEVACSALASCHWGLRCGDEFTPTIQKHLEEMVFIDKSNKELFVRDTIEPYLEGGHDIVLGLNRLTTDDEFTDISGNLALEWIEKYKNLSNRSLRELFKALIRYANKEKVVRLIRDNIEKRLWKDEEQREMWMGAAFVLDFDNNSETLITFAQETREHFWPLCEMANLNEKIYEGWVNLTASQNHFLVTNFGPSWPPADYPSYGWSGNQNPWDASKIINSRITDLAADLSDHAAKLLQELININGLEGYQNHIKHLYSQQIRLRSEAKKMVLPIQEVRKILLKGEPSNHDDLQALLMDELDALQNRIRNGSTNDILPYWRDETPHDENYCRDRIMSAINPYLERYHVRAHTEGTMPNSNRCDLLNTYKLMNLPIEIKGQWHSAVWTAAGEQLQNYTNEYHSEGYGIYLVLWFGYLGVGHQKNPHGWPGQPLPKTLDEMKLLLQSRSESLPDKTKVMVFDLSKP